MVFAILYISIEILDPRTEKELESGLRGYDTDLNEVQAIENSFVTIQILSLLHMKSLVL
jgi:hypothetical protein